MSGGHNAANALDNAVGLWNAELRRLYDDLCEKEAIEARIYELYRNNHHMRGLVDRLVDMEVGPKVLVRPSPDHKALGVSRDEAAEWAKKVSCYLDPIFNSAEGWITANRQQDLTQLARSASKMRWMTGEVFAIREWRNNTPLMFKTCFQLVSSHRVKTPRSRTLNRVYHGIELDRYGAAMGYHVEAAETNDSGGFRRAAKKSKRISKYTPRGPFWQVCHSFDPLMPEYPRGISPIAAVLVLCKQAERGTRAILDKEIIAATYALVVTSNSSPREVAEMMLTGDERSPIALPDEKGGMSPEQKQKCDDYVDRFWNSRVTNLFGSSWVHALPGEEIKVVQSDAKNQPTTEFLQDYHRNITGGVGMPYEIASGDFSNVNFAGGQMSAGVFEYMINIQRKTYGRKVLDFIYRNMLDELMLVRAPDGVADIGLLGGMNYMQNREAYARVNFAGTRRLYSDEFKSARSDHLRQSDRTTSASKIIMDRGEDPEDIAMEIADDAVRSLEATRAAFARAGHTMSAAQEQNYLLQATARNAVDPELLVEESRGAAEE